MTANNQQAILGTATLDDMIESSGDPRDLTSNQITELRSVFEDESGYGLWLFAYHICGCHEITMDLHLEECQFLSEWGNIYLADGTKHKRPPLDREQVTDSYRRLHMCVPRDTFKTTLGTRSLALWTMLKNPEVTVGIFNESEAKAKSWIGAIKQVIERSHLLQVLWKDRLPPGLHFEDTRSVPRNWKWGDTGLLLVRDSYNVSELTVEPFGIGGASTGKHFTHKVLDDIIGEKSIDSAAVMQDAITWVDHGRALERPADQGCELVNYTRWAYFDVYRHMLEKWPGEYKLYHRSLLENPVTREPDVVNGQSIFPERFPTTLARKMYNDDPFVFASQRMCIPQAGRETSFNKDWLRSGWVELLGNRKEFVIQPNDYDPTVMHSDLQGTGEYPLNRVPLSMMSKAILLDPAPPPGTTESRQQPHSRNGIQAVGKDCWGRNFLLEERQMRADPNDVLETIVELCLRWSIDLVGIEEVNFSKVYAPLWTTILSYKYPGLYLSFFPLETKNRDKDMRIRALLPSFRQGFWYLNQEACGYTRQELLEYPHGQTRDLIDALAYTEDALTRPQSLEEQHEQRRHGRELDAGRDPFTRY